MFGQCESLGGVDSWGEKALAEYGHGFFYGAERARGVDVGAVVSCGVFGREGLDFHGGV